MSDTYTPFLNGQGQTVKVRSESDVVGADTVQAHHHAISAATAGGCSPYQSLDLDETEEEVKATAGQVYGYSFYNNAASNRYLKFYNATAANTTVGTTTPVMTLVLPNGAAGHISFSAAVEFTTAITIAATTGLANNDTGAPSANDVVVTVFYK
jgi:hypothetical protein